jgi:hypothetical protein
MKNLFLSLILTFALPVGSGICSEASTSTLDLAKYGFLDRWHDFAGDENNFPFWSPDWTTDELKARFDQIQQDRWALYFVHPEDHAQLGSLEIYSERYQRPEGWGLWGSRYPYPISFSYNLASPLYNASIVTIKDKQFLALEAPTQGNLAQFYDLLEQYHITDLIRLTSVFEKSRESCFPYWEGNVNVGLENGQSILEIVHSEIRYFFIDHWENHEALETKSLIALVKAVMENEDKDQMIAVHCRAGVGRTGVFLAAYTLIHEIDEQVAKGIQQESLQISVDRVIWELSLQRPLMVSDFVQYLSLHELVNTYVESTFQKPGN